MKMPIRLGPWLEGEGKVNVDKNGDLSKEHTQSWRFLHLLTDPCSTKDTVQWFGQVRRSREIDEGECTTSLMLLCFMSYSAFACAEEILSSRSIGWTLGSRRRQWQFQGYCRCEGTAFATGSSFAFSNRNWIEVGGIQSRALFHPAVST